MISMYMMLFHKTSDDLNPEQSRCFLTTTAAFFFAELSIILGSVRVCVCVMMMMKVLGM